MQKGLFEFAVRTLDFAQAVITTARVVLDDGIATAMNSAPVVANARDDQNIRTAEFTIPVIYADVITYKPGELGNNTAIGREGASVYYTPEALKDAEYLATVESSLISVGTHEKNTSENNKSPDGFVRRARWDEKEKRVVMDAMAAGDRECEYIERNKAKPGFGASAFLKFLELKRASGTAPSGKPYDAIATKIVNDHVAIMDGVRDPRNMVIAMNAMEQAVPDEAVKPESSQPAKKAKSKNGGKMPEDAKETPVSKEAIRNTIQEMEAEKARNEESEKTRKGIEDLGARMSKIESYMANGGKNGVDTTTDTAQNQDPEKKDEGKKDDSEEAANAKNAMPTEEVIADCADFLGMKFEKPPTFNQLGSLLGVKGKNFSETVTAVNAKRKEIVAARKTSGSDDFSLASAANAEQSQGGFMSALNAM